MEIIKDSQMLNCVRPECSNERKYYCEDHKERLCDDCRLALHFSCTTPAIGSVGEVIKALALITNLADSLSKNAITCNLASKIDGLEESLKNIAENSADFKERADSAIKSDKFLEFSNLITEGSQIINKILKGGYGKSADGTNPILRLLFDLQVIYFSQLKAGSAPADLTGFLGEEYDSWLEKKTKELLEEVKHQVEKEVESRFQSKIEDLTKN